MCCAAWFIRLRKDASDLEREVDANGLRDHVAMSALVGSSSSAAMYIAFLLLWAYSSSFNGRRPMGAAAIWVGLLSAAYAVVGGLFARAAQRPLIVASAGANVFLWMLASAASAAV